MSESKAIIPRLVGLEGNLAVEIQKLALVSRIEALHLYDNVRLKINQKVRPRHLAEVIAILLTRVTVTERGCWERAQNDNGKGYSSVQLTLPKRTRLSAHRLSYLLFYGVDPFGFMVCHSCDNPPCCNPDHLFLGTQMDNYEDALIKGLRPRGAAIKSAKLTDEIVVKMRAAYASGVSQGELGRQYGVERKVAGKAIRGVTWRHVPFQLAS